MLHGDSGLPARGLTQASCKHLVFESLCLDGQGVKHLRGVLFHFVMGKSIVPSLVHVSVGLTVVTVLDAFCEQADMAAGGVVVGRRSTTELAFGLWWLYCSGVAFARCAVMMGTQALRGKGSPSLWLVG